MYLGLQSCLALVPLRGLLIFGNWHLCRFWVCVAPETTKSISLTSIHMETLIGGCIRFPTPLQRLPQPWGLPTTEIYSLIVLEARSLKWRCQQSWFLLKALKENLCRVSFITSGALAILVIPWLNIISLQSLPLAPLSPVFLCTVSFSVSYKDTVIGFGAYCNPGWSHFKILILIISAKILITNKVTFWGSRRTYLFGGTIQPTIERDTWTF